MKYFIGLDLGTTVVKASLFDEEGAFISDSAIEQQLIYLSNGFIEQDASRWYSDAVSVITEVISNGQIRGGDVAGLSISSQGITIVPVDGNYRPLRNAINWLDSRPKSEIQGLIDGVGRERLTELTGKPAIPGYSVPQLMWIRNHEPDVFGKARWFMMPMDFLMAKLTGVSLTDHSMAAGSLGYSIARMDWSDEILDAAGLDKMQFPNLAWAGQPVGTLSRQAASDTGLSAGCVVGVGGQDQKVAAFGARIEQGIATCSMGTCGAFEFLLTSPTPHPRNQLTLCPYLEKNHWVMEGCINSFGGAIKWLRDTICQGSSYQEMDAEAARSQAGAGGVLFYPFLTTMGTPHTVSSRLAGFENLRLNTNRADLIRAVYESLAYECRLNLEAAVPYTGAITQLNVFSGGSRSDILCQMIADVTRYTVCAFDFSEMGSLGAARLAAKACGMDWQTFGDGLLAKQRRYVPGDSVNDYERFFMEYRKGLGQN